MLQRERTIQHVIDTAASRLEPIARGALQQDIENVAAMLTEREPERSLSDSRQDVQGHLTDLFEALELFRSPPPTSTEDDEGQ